MATQVDEAIKHDLTAEVAEWIEAFDDVVAARLGTGRRAAVGACGPRAREAGVPATGDDHHALLQHHSQARRGSLPRRPQARDAASRR